MMLSNSHCSSCDKKKEVNEEGKSKYNAHNPNKYILTVEWNGGQSVNLEVFPHSKPEEIAFNFCKRYNLDFTSMEKITQQIKALPLTNYTCARKSAPCPMPIESKSKLIEKIVKKYQTEHKTLFDPYEYMFKSGRDSSKATQKNSYTSSSSMTSTMRNSKPRERKGKKLLPITIEQNSKRLKAFLAKNDQFTELLFHRSKLKSTDELDSLRSTQKPVTQRSLKHNDTNSSSSSHPLQLSVSSRKKRSYSSLFSKGKEKSSVPNHNNFNYLILNTLQSNCHLDKYTKVNSFR